MARLSPVERRAQQQQLQRAIALIQQGRAEAARGLLEAVLHRWPEQPDALHFLGVLSHQQGDPERALALIERALRGAPDTASIWNNHGNVLRLIGRLDDAEQSYRRSVTLGGSGPPSNEARGNLADLLARRGALAPAAALYRECLRHDPDNPVLAHHLAACLGTVPARASDAYLRALFDRHAPRFDADLDALHYCAPEQLVGLVDRAIEPGGASLDIADLGCGTGRAGPLLRPWARELVGCDLSAGMLAQCRARALYDRLHEQELTAFLRHHPASFDLLVCADTLIYFGDLHEVAAAAAAALRPGGHFAFSAEALGDEAPGPIKLHPHGRVAHRRDHVAQAMGAAGLQLPRLGPFTVRVEAGHAVPGWLGLARRPAPGETPP